KTLDPAAISDYLTLMYVRAPRTPFAAIRKLPPAHYLVSGRSGIRVERWWTLRAPADGDGSATGDTAGEIRDLLDDSVRIRLRSDVPVGAFLSGGLDSSSICALAARHLQQPLQTYAVGFEGTEFDETGYSRTVANALHTDHHETLVHFEHALEHLPTLCWHLDEPHGD